jgi:hypothetical protein
VYLEEWFVDLFVVCEYDSVLLAAAEDLLSEGVHPLPPPPPSLSSRSLLVQRALALATAPTLVRCKYQLTRLFCWDWD